MHFVVVGGHPTPAMSFLAAASNAGHTLTFIARHLGIAGLAPPELKLVESYHPIVKSLQAPKLDRHQLMLSLFKLPQLYRAYRQALEMLKESRPDAVITFGGFLSVPVGLAASRLKIPLIIHEQTTVAGLANEQLARFANVVAISYPSSKPFFPANKVQLIGNLLRPELLNYHPQPCSFLPQPLPKPVLYITGGSQGSRFINRLVAAVYPQLLQKYLLVHQTGVDPVSLASLDHARSTLTRSERSDLITHAYLAAGDTSAVMHQAHVVIARAGANTLAELLALSLPAILIPLEPTHRQEQLKNAQLLSRSGAAILMRQSTATPQTLLSQLDRLETNYTRYVTNYRQLRSYVHPQAATALVDIATHTVKKERIPRSGRKL